MRLTRPLFEVGLVALLTTLYLANGGYDGVRAARAGGGGDSAATVEAVGAVVLLVVFWAVALARLWYVLRYAVRVDDGGVTVFDGFARRRVRWDEAFVCEARSSAAVVHDAEDLDHPDPEAAPETLMEMRDAAGRVRLRIDGSVLAPEHRERLSRLLDARLRRARLTGPSR